MPTFSSSDKATLYQLSQPEKLSSVLAQDKLDCFSCRLTGGAAFVGLGAYTYISSNRQLEAQKEKILKSGSRFGLAGRRAGVVVLSAMLVGMGCYRLVN